MKYTVDGWNNFCSVFELPERYPSGFCFGGGIPVTVTMVDWFNPVSGMGQPAISKEQWVKKLGEFQTEEVSDDGLRESLLPWVSMKNYVKKGRTYLILCNFGASLTFKGGEPMTQEDEVKP